jgi:PAS domain S-box-containing protein
MKVRTKLIIGFSAAMVLLWLIVIYAISNVGILKEHFVAVENDIIPNTVDIGEIAKAADEAYQSTMDYALYNLSESKDSAESQIQELEQLSDKYLPQTEEINSDEYSDNQKLVAQINMLILSLTNIINLKEQGIGHSELLALDRNTSLPAIANLEQSIGERQADSIIQLAAISEDYKQAHFDVVHWLLVSAGLLTILVVAAAYLTTRSIVRPLHALHKGTEMIARGRLDYKVGTKAKDEIGQLSRAFDQMTTSLNKSMTSIDTLNKEITERTNVEEALRKSEERYRDLFDNASELIQSIDHQGKFIYANKAWHDSLGYDEKEMADLTFTDIIHPYYLEHCQDIFQRLMLGEAVPRIEAVFVSKHGDLIQVEGDVTAQYENNQIVATRGIFRDVTESKKAAEALQKSEEKFSKAFRSSPNTVAITTLEGGRFIEVNDSFTDLTGYTREEAIGHSAKELNIWENTGDRDDMLRILKRDGSVHDHEYKFRIKSGEIRIWSFSAELLDIGTEPCMISMTVDITERKNMEEALRIREERFSDIADSALEWIWEIDAKGKYTYSSPVVKNILGYKPEEVLEKHFYDLFHPEDKQELKKAAFTAFEQKQIFRDFVNRNVHKSGKVVYLSTSGVPILDAEGNLLGYRGVDTDITEQHKRGRLQQDENYVLTLLGQGAELGEILDAIIHLGEDHDPSIKGSILIYDPVKQWLNPASGPNLPQKYLQMMKDGIPVGPNMGSCGTSAYNKKRVVVPDIAESPLFRQFEEVANTAVNNNLLACWSQPILSSNGELLGTIANYSSKTGEPDPDDIKILEWSARIAAIAIERKQAEEALQESEDKFSKAFRSSPNTIAITTLKEGRFIEVNDSFTDLTGYTREEAIGHSAKEINIWENTKDRDRMLRILKRDGRVHNHEYNFRIKSGEIRTWTFSAELIDIGTEPCMISMTLDITEQKRAQEAIRESEEKFSKAFHSSPAAISISLLSDGSFIEINNSYTRITGYTRKELIGHTAEEYNMWAKARQKVTMVRKMQNREKINNEEYEFRNKSGKIHTMLVSTEYLTLGGKPCALVTSTDITERKRMEEALRESEDKFNKAFHASPDIVAIVRKKDHKYLEVNENFLKFYGFTRDEVIGRSPSEIGIWGNIRERRKLTKMIGKEERVRNEEIQMNTKSGETRVGLFSVEKVSFGGEPCFVAMTVDITERKRMEEDLRINEKRFRLIADNATDLISRIQLVPTIRSDYISPSCLRITGYRQEEFYKDPKLGLEMIHPEDRDFFVKHLTLENQKDQKPVTVRLIRKNGQVIWIEQTHTVISNEKGKPVAMHLISRDITERKTSEEQLQTALSNLERSSAQLAATNKELETFSYSVSHDLRSPLRSIDGFSQALLEDYAESLDETGKDYLSRLRTASQKMGELIDGLLKLSRLTRGEIHQEEVDLSTLVEEITSRLQENEPKRKADFIIRKGLVARGDRELLRALFENLLGNAWKFTSKSEKARIEFGTTKNGRKTTYFINDNGAGFDMAYADKLFGAFQRLHDASEFPGTGIGLATVLRIINRHGGNIWAKGAVNKGATFYFTLN